MQQDENKYYVKLNNEYIKGDLKLTSKELAIMILLCQTKNLNNQSIFTIQYLMDKLGYECESNPSRNLKFIRDILIQLEKDGILRFYKDIIESKDNLVQAKTLNRSKYCIATDDMLPQEYTMLYNQDIENIIEYCNNNPLDRYKLLHLYTYICCHISNNKQNENYKLCYMTINKLSEELEFRNETIYKYLDALDDKLKIIYHDYAGYGYTNNIIKSQVTHYCRYEDKEILNNKLNEIRKDKNIKESNYEKRKLIHKKISVKQKINYLKNKENKNTITDIENEKLEQLKDEYENINTNILNL